MIPINPLLQAPRPKPQRKIPKYWSPEEARRFLALMEGDRTWPIWAFLLGSGLRIGELVSLRWPSVDLKNRRVRIVDFVSTLGYDMMPSSGKSRDAIRTVDLDDGLADVLRKQKVMQKAERLAATDWIESDFVFTRPDGGQYHPMNLSRLLATYTTELDVPRLTAHGLRHTSATLMLASGVPPKVAAERLGHADATLFTNLYSHVTPTMQREAAEKIGSMLFGEDSYCGARIRESGNHHWRVRRTRSADCRRGLRAELPLVQLEIRRLVPMPLFDMTDGSLQPVQPTTFAAEHILERTHLQAAFKRNISLLGDDLMVIAEEFGHSRTRIGASTSCALIERLIPS